MRSSFLYLRLILFPSILFLVCCSEPPGDKLIREGKQLAQKHCVSCHQFPEPDLLDKTTWVFHVLPKMGGLLGFRHFETTNYFENEYVKQSMPLEEWNKIVRYYVRMSPENPKSRDKKIGNIDTSLKQFSVVIPNVTIKPPLTSFAGIFPETNEVIFGDGITKQVYRLHQLKLKDSMSVDIGISNVNISNGKISVLSMGVMYPSDVKSGKLVSFNDKRNIVLDSLQRPVFSEHVDLNSDSMEDIIVCEFGNNTGQLSWFQNLGSSYKKHILKPLPGAVKTVSRDFNNDGKPDILAMMAQADEGMFIYFNEGNNRFREERILQFSPAYGSNYFELRDMNNDGFDDIIATNGDNGDYPAILKAYHGVRVYLNDGNNKFHEKLFLPVNGACKVVARDFDGDGDSDLASIAYFPDYENTPLESFIYWENTGQLSFKPYSFSQATSGRWLVMDAGDIDKDGDDDIILGSAKMAMGVIPDAVMKKWNQESPSLLVLRNNLKAER